MRDAAQERRDVDALVHRVLLVGGALAALFLMVSIAASLIERRGLPRHGMGPVRIWHSLIEGHPGGLAALGLLVLILTPPLRVLGSVLAFLYERDYRYVVVTAVVFALMTLSFLLGQG